MTDAAHARTATVPTEGDASPRHRGRAVTVTSVSKAYHRGAEVVTALEDVSLTLDAGDLLAVSGPSGSGKTTLLNVLAGWEEPDHGQVRWADDVDPRAPNWRSLAIAPQRLGLLSELTVGENVELPLRLGCGADEDAARERLAAALELFGLGALAHRMPEEVSLGEQQRTALARALVVAPRVLLADEPTGNQDAGWASGVIQGLRAAQADGTAVLVATHDEEVIARADRRLTMRDGRTLDP